MNIANWLYSTARISPKSAALFEGQKCIADYMTFASKASHLSQWMQSEFGLRAGDRIVLAMKNCVEYLELLYAVLWAGGVVVPVNQKLHAREIAWIVHNAEARLLLSDDGNLGKQAALPDECREFGRAAAKLVAAGASSRMLPPAGLCSRSLAWLFYTSGTTGRPKGVMLTHGNLVSMSLCYPADVDGLCESDVVLYAAPLSHGAGLYNFIHVRAGARHVVPESRGFDPKEILDLAGQLRRLTFFAAPTMVRRLVSEAKTSGRSGDGIQTIVYGGGPMYAADIEEALEVFGPKFVQIYGQGETPMTITSLSRAVIANRDVDTWRKRVNSVGIAQSCVDVRVVNDRLENMPVGAPGEIVVRGPTVMQGYWRNEEATSNTIVDNWLKTGDIGYLDEDGFLTLTDRSKDVIISGGANIYPREVEEVLLQHPGIAEVAVVGQPNPEWGEEVVAFIVPKDRDRINTQELDDWCLREIAAFKRPRRYEFCSALPVNAYGKILKTELRELLQRQSQFERNTNNYTPPADSLR